MDKSEAIVNKIHYLSTAWSRHGDQVLLERIGIGLSQYKILNAVAHNEKLQQRSIALELGQTEASVSRQVKLLISKGLISVRNNPANRREHFAELTATGLQVRETGRQSLAAFYRTVTMRISPRQQEVLMELLSSVGD